MPIRASGAEHQAVRLVDRASERSALDTFLGSVLKGESRALVLVGEPGIGKTALPEYPADARTGGASSVSSASSPRGS